MSVQETIRRSESPLETQYGWGEPWRKKKEKGTASHSAFAVLHTPYGSLTSRHTWRRPSSHGAILSVRTDSLPLWLFQVTSILKFTEWWHSCTRDMKYIRLQLMVRWYFLHNKQLCINGQHTFSHILPFLHARRSSMPHPSTTYNS